MKYPTLNFIVFYRRRLFTFDWMVTGGLPKVLMFQRLPSENILQKISNSYRKVPNPILWEIFSKFLKRETRKILPNIARGNMR